jgi:nucleoid-associated protein YgaU
MVVCVACFSGCKATPNSANEESPAGQQSILEPVDAPVPEPGPPQETIVDNPDPAPFNAPPVSQAEPLPKWQYAPANPNQARVHVVEPKETLYAIARRYYNDEKHWRKILEANRNRISDPNKIEVGMKLIIP